VTAARRLCAQGDRESPRLRWRKAIVASGVRGLAAAVALHGKQQQAQAPVARSSRKHVSLG
jgi:hypothetical protein